MLEIHGIIPPVLTTFTREEHLDKTLFRAQVRYLLDAGVHGISPGGSTGEGAALTNDELAEMISIIKEENHDQVPIVAGVIRSSTAEAVRTGLTARDAGASALMVTPTFYNVLVPDDDGNVAYYQAISDQIQLPIVVYNVVPQNEVSPALFDRLLDIENVIGIKQSVGGIMAMYDMKATCGDRGLVFAATDEMIHSCFTLGADGAISAILSLFPRLSVKMWDLTQAGRNEDALAIQNTLFPVWKIIRGPQFPARMKAAARLLGRDCGFSRSPVSSVDQELEARMATALAGIVDQ